MRKLIYLSVVFLLILASCSSERGSGVRIGFLIHSTENKRWATDVEYLKNKSAEIGAQFIMKDAKGDENVQLKQASEILEEDIDVLIVVAANQNTAGGIVRAAHEKGVKVISYDRLIKNADVDYLISFDYKTVGKLMAQYVADRKPGGNCIVLWGDPNDANAVFIKNGHEEILNLLSGDQKMNVVFRSYVEGWHSATAEILVDKVLDFSDKKIDAVIASNIPLGQAAYNSLLKHDYKPGEVTVTSMDVTLDFVHSLLDDGITMTVNKPISDLANGAIELAVAVAKNKKVEQVNTSVYNGRIDVPSILFAPYVIDKTNLDEKLISTGVFTRDEVYGNRN